MGLRLLFAIVFLATITGCASLGQKPSQENLQSRVTELEKKLEEKDSEVVDLQYQLKDISGKVAPSKDLSEDLTEAVETSSRSKTGTKSYGNDEIIRVPVSATDVQQALKNAGIYTGKIDGKIGPGTKQAILEFQSANNLTADGILGRKTWSLLKSYLKD